MPYLNSYTFDTTCTGSVITTTNLTAYYKLNSDGLDTTSNALHLSSFGSPTYSVGRFGNAISLNGTSQYANRADNTLFEGSGGTISVFGWVKVTDYVEAAPAMASKWDGSTTGWRIIPRASDILVTIGNSNISKGTGVATETWTHIGFTHDNTNTVIYQNGVSAGTINNTGAKTLANTQAFYIGRASSASANFFKGLIDDVSVWQRVLGKAEVLSLYQSSCPLSGS